MKTKCHENLLLLALTAILALSSFAAASAQLEKTVAVSSNVCNDELLKGYVQQLFDESLGIQPAKTRAVNGRSSLTDAGQKLYDKLEDEITMTAKGEQLSAEIRAPCYELSSSTRAWTEAELGTTILEGGNLKVDEAELNISMRVSAYKTQICNIYSYNDDAAGVSPPPPRGNPWQLVWVLDDEANTTVVCEGYPKALKYLCDLSNFSYVDSLIATGGRFI